ncbi:MAG TPA: glycosyltransferase family 39 protein, partial [Chloroflexota bacterium]|nr:glycosyltransferase family 39 protein [Chloroflexota bacterium]
WFRDELYYIEAGKHLAGGYVDFPLGVAVLADVQRWLFGPSLTAIHVFSPIAGALIIVLTGLMAREMDGGLAAQRIAGLSALVAPAFIGADALLTMDAFDELWWTLAAFVLIRLLRLRQRAGEDASTARLWLLFGLVCGVGLLTKLTMLSFGLAVVVGLMASLARAEFRRPWPWIGGIIALLALVPYAIWNAQHGWPTLTFWQNYSHGEDTPTFLIQVVLLMQPLALPLWVAGLVYLLRNPDARPYRPLGWAFLFLAALFLAGHAKSYFLVPAFPALLAAGGIVVERRMTRRPRLHLGTIAAVALIVGGAALAPVVAPILPARTFAKIMPNPIQPVADRFGWPQFVGTVTRVDRALPPDERQSATILAGNYGEASALDLLGKGLPPVISPHNTYYFWTAGTVPRGTVIATDFDRSYLLQYFRSVRKVASVPSEYGIQNEEVGRAVWVCRGLKVPWATAWRELRNFS